MQTDPFTGRPTCIQGGRLPSEAERRALQHDHRRRLEALARLSTAAARVGIGTDPDDDLVLWESDEIGLLAGADALWQELDAAARAFRELLPMVSLEDFGFPPEVEDLLAECGPHLRPISSGVEATAFEAPVFEDSVSGTPNPVQCRSDLPGDIYLSAEMSAEDQAALLK